jgi:hypothetical protein
MNTDFAASLTDGFWLYRIMGFWLTPLLPFHACRAMNDCWFNYVNRLCHPTRLYPVVRNGDKSPCYRTTPHKWGFTETGLIRCSLIALRFIAERA